MSSTTTISGLTDQTETSDATSPGCTTAIPGKYGHVPPDACNSYYTAVPDFNSAIAFATLFGILTLVHFYQAIAYKKASHHPHQHLLSPSPNRPAPPLSTAHNSL